MLVLVLIQSEAVFVIGSTLGRPKTSDECKSAISHQLDVSAPRLSLICMVITSNYDHVASCVRDTSSLVFETLLFT